MLEKELQRDIAGKLREAGWFVTITAQSRSTQRQVSGLPDIIAFRDNVTLLVECKGEYAKVRHSQVEFENNIHEHLGPNLLYVMAWHPLQLPRWVYERQ